MPVRRARYPSLVRNLGPALYWPLDSSSGATDLSGNSRNGTGGGSITIGGLNTPLDAHPSTPGNSEHQTALDGSDDVISSSYAAFSDTDDRTYTVWTAREGVNADAYFGGDGGAAAPELFGVALSTNIAYRVRASDGGATSQALWSSPGYVVGVWNHLALVTSLGSDSAELYVNGESEGAVTGLTQTHSVPGNFKVGAFNATSNAFQGRMAHVAVFERALSAAEILALYQAGRRPRKA